LEIHQSELYHPDCTPSWWGSHTSAILIDSWPVQSCTLRCIQHASFSR